VKKREISQLRHERERRGWSRNYVAEQVEVDVVTVGRWERGERLPHPVYRQKLCTLFEMNAQSLGLFTEPSLNLDEKKEVSDKPPDVLDPSEELSFDSIQTATNLPEQIPVEKKKLFPVSLPAVYTRRSVLIGLGGITALAGASFLFASRSRALRSTGPVHIVADKPFQHFLDTTVNWITSGSTTLPGQRPTGSRCAAQVLPQVLWRSGVPPQTTPPGRSHVLTRSDRQPGLLMVTIWRSRDTVPLSRFGSLLFHTRSVGTCIPR